MNQLDLKPDWTRYTWTALVCAIIYLFVQVLPATVGSFTGTGTAQVITKQAAEQAAAQFIQAQFGEQPISTHTVHQSDSLFYGYLSKEDLLEDYDKRYDADFPTDTFQVTAKLPDESRFYVYVHMETGKVVAWNKPDASIDEQLSADQWQDEAIAYAEQRGFQSGSLTVKDTGVSDVLTLEVKGEQAHEANLTLKIRMIQLASGQFAVAEYKPEFTVPASYTSYVKEQDKLANGLSLIGSTLMSFVLFVLAIVYAVLYRKQTSFNRGWLLTALFLLIYMANNWNMLDGLVANYGEDENAFLYAVTGMAIQSIITVLLAASVYFSLVAGDGLWRSMGKQLWPRMGEAGYGQHVWDSMKLGYLIAFILLGIQTVIFIVLELSTDAWSTTDVMQSPYNFAAPWVFPALAWCAAISEEVVFRLFGIGLLRKWFKNAFVASLIPTIIWALGHVTYAIYPSTTRLIELTILGLLFSFFFLRYGLITVIFAHAVLDLIMMALSLMFLGSAGNIIIGLFYMVTPVLVAALIRWWANKKGRARDITAPPSVLQ
ncbi:hypothetical protein FHS18_000425 [Paenibacillus phyllosphaerae]|uniref:CAAX prenyl protease 2/Lysostaphin resistance protein A-like domain-containing protein n=1 Tax=Paenibacillus phyllosphaerae TaxID=274593 RepID=A0A7W5ATJ5_9BACL|nr:CPBP family intramembrane glutamic endopeptidase [Paenibacillus phyllosphaerae]MBB3108397.1 hypothetical protein [Paenibacillus phyllosphaerae]